MEVMFVGLFTYVPAHLAYDVVARTTCAYWSQDYGKCLMNENSKYGNILNILSAVLILLGVLFDVLVFIYAKGLNLYNCKVTDADYTPSLYAPIPHEDQELHPTGASSLNNNPTLLTTMGGSPASTGRQGSPIQRRRFAANEGTKISEDGRRHIPNSDITVFRNPSSLTSSSAGETSSQIDPQTGVTYAQVVFPPDRRKRDDGTTSPKRMVVRADVPLHHLSSQDVRAQLSNLKSFNIAPKKPEIEQEPSSSENENPSLPKRKELPKETDLDFSLIRPQSPETDF